MNYQERLARLDSMVREDRIIRCSWTGSRDGVELACLLSAVSPEVAQAESPDACPADVMPAWLAGLVPDFNDRGDKDAWPGFVARFAALTRRWPALDEAAWERARLASMAAFVEEARSHAPASEMQVLEAIDLVLVWLRAGAPAEQSPAALALVPPEGTGDAAWWALQAAASAALRGNEGWGLRAVADAAPQAAWWGGGLPAWQRVGLRAACWDRMASSTLGAIEAECVLAEGGVRS
jgi:hypothetical protein